MISKTTSTKYQDYIHYKAINISTQLTREEHIEERLDALFAELRIEIMQ